MSRTFEDTATARPTPGSATYADVVGQATGWTAAVDAVEAQWGALRSNLLAVSPKHVVLVGCGSTHHLAEVTAALWRDAADWIVTTPPASDVLHDPHGLLPWPDQTVMVTLSRSGATSETLAAVDAFRAVGGASVWSVNCRSQSSLTQMSDIAVAIDEGFEAQVAETRSFSSMLVATESLARLLHHRPIWPAKTVERSADKAVAIAQATLDDTERLSVLKAVRRIDLLGSGPRYGIAREGTLKLVEMSLTNSSAFHFPEYRHGPKAMVCDTTLVVGVVHPSESELGLSLLDEVIHLGGHTLAIPAPLDGPLASVMPTLQLLAVRRAELADIDPDRPRHLSAVVELPTSDHALRINALRSAPIRE
jgi:glucosamine--fructose-6-phosphate aminotransferase (isomerizing)